MFGTKKACIKVPGHCRGGEGAEEEEERGGGIRKMELTELGEADRGGEGGKGRKEEQSALLNGNGLSH